MSQLQQKIYDYFNHNAGLKVLFVFDGAFLADELGAFNWEPGFRYVDFKGDWFTVKYLLDNDWQNDKVILLFRQPSPLKNKSLATKFPLMDLLVANLEFHNQDYAAFMQQYNLPETDQKMTRFVEKNIGQLQSDKMIRLFEPYYSDHSISTDIFVRGFISSFMGQSSILDWETIIVRVLLLGRASERKKHNEFHNRLNKNTIVADELSKKLKNIFGVAFDANTEEKVGSIVKVLKYNAIVQNLAPVQADNYQQYRIVNTMALQQMNSILSFAYQRNAAEMDEVFYELGSAIRDEEIIRWYGTNANYSFVPERLCIPILKILLADKIETEPEAVISRIEVLLPQFSHSALGKVMDYALLVARFYKKMLALGSFTLNTPDEYITRYQDDYYLIDQLYRQAEEAYFKIEPACELYATVQQTKNQLSQNYAKFCNRLNLQWIECVKEKGGMNSVNLLRQPNFYENLIEPLQKKVAVIVSDALRFEVAEELIDKLAENRHKATLSPALAMLPTETKYCKPSLLPYSVLKLYGQPDNQDMAVDDRILNSIDKRSEQLQRYKEGAACVSFESVAEYNEDKNRALFKKPLVYVFHDTIDKVGHDGNAKQIVNSCREAINELAQFIHTLLSSYNVTEVYVTSDHGFLFNDIEFAEKDKHKIVEDTLERSSRYYLTHSDSNVDGIVKFPLGEVSAMDNSAGVYVAVPQGTNRLAAPSGGYMFTHGGAALQEIIIPVIECHYKRNDNKQPVGVTLLGRNLSMQASRLRFKLLQTEAVSMDTKKRDIEVALYLNGEQVTAIQKITLDKTDASLDDRQFQIDLTLNRNVDPTKVLRLKVFDSTDKLNPLIDENVTNNTLIENDFDF